MAWLVVDGDGKEGISYNRPFRSFMGGNRNWMRHELDYVLTLPKGSIKRLIGSELTWDDEPFEFNEINNEPIPTNP
jgi:hypothetical protein